jgi:predicted nucleic-acid-binding Zn-ribbon protein
MKVIAFTKNSPACPKCGHKTKRYYEDHDANDVYPEIMRDLPSGEYFHVVCQDCGYEFSQRIKKS